MSLKIIGNIEITDIVDDDNTNEHHTHDKNGNVYLYLLKQVLNKLNVIERKLIHQEEQIKFIKQQNNSIMQTLEDLKALVAQENTVIDSAITLLNGLSEQIGNLKPDQVAIDSLAAEVKAKSDALAAAVTANTPAQG